MEKNNQLPEMEENLSMLGALPFLASFPPKALKLLAFLSRRITLCRGELLLDENEDFARACVVISGRLQVIRKTRGTESSVLNYLPGDFFGGFSLLSPMPSLFVIRATEPCSLLTFEREQFLKLLDQFPETGRIIVKSLVSELYQWERRNLNRDTPPSTLNVGATLL